MAKRNQPRAERESGMSGLGEVADTRMLRDWLRIVDKPLAKEKPERGRGAKR